MERAERLERLGVDATTIDAVALLAERLLDVAGGDGAVELVVLADRPAAPPVPWTVFGPTAAVSAEGLGDFRLHPTLPPGGFSEGATLLSLDTRGIFGHGPVVGIYPDALTLLPLLHAAAPGNVFRFTDTAGTYPHTDLYLPPGSLPIGTEVDVAMLYLTSSGYQATGPLRVTSH